MSIENAGDPGNTSSLAELVGPDKKYKTLDDLARSRVEADRFIEQLKEENEIARKELESLGKAQHSEATVKDLMKLMREGRNSTEEGNHPESEEEFSKRVLDIIKGDAQARTRARNREQGDKLVLDMVKGDVEAKERVLASRAAELGISKDRLLAVSEESPNAFAKLIGTEQRQLSQSPTAMESMRGTEFNQGPVMEVDGHKTKAYYDNRRKEMGVAKYISDKKLMAQILKDRTALGERFYN
jgi:hypothetical protein